MASARSRARAGTPRAMVEKGRIARTPAIEGGSKEEAEKKETKDVTGDVSGVIGGVRGGGRKRTGVHVGVGFACELVSALQV